MAEFASAVRTTHLVLVAFVTAILLFTFSPREVNTYAAARFEAQFLARLSFFDYVVTTRQYQNLLREAYRESLLTIAKEYGFEPIKKIYFRAPIIVLRPNEDSTIEEIASLLQSRDGPSLIGTPFDYVREGIATISGKTKLEPFCFRRFIDSKLDVCDPVPPGTGIVDISILEKKAGGEYDSAHSRYTAIDDDIEELGEFYLFFEFRINNKKVSYLVGAADQNLKFEMTESYEFSPSHWYSQKIVGSRLISRANGYSVPINQIRNVLQYKLDKWLNKKKELDVSSWGKTLNLTMLATKKVRAPSEERDDYISSHFLYLPHLDELWPEVAKLSPDEAVSSLAEKASRSRQAVSMAGQTVDASMIRIAAPMACFALSIYLSSTLAMLRDVRRRCAPSQAAALLQYPWIGFSNNIICRILTAITVLFLPVLAPLFLLFQHSPALDITFYSGLLFMLLTCGVGVWSMKIINELRLASNFG